jgi:hypothetical protein
MREDHHPLPSQPGGGAHQVADVNLPRLARRRLLRRRDAATGDGRERCLDRGRGPPGRRRRQRQRAVAGQLGARQRGRGRCCCVVRPAARAVGAGGGVEDAGERVRAAQAAKRRARRRCLPLLPPLSALLPRSRTCCCGTWSASFLSVGSLSVPACCPASCALGLSALESVSDQLCVDS